MSEKLEACPFCGGEASLTIPSEHAQADCADIYVSCDECEAEGLHFVVEMHDRTPDLWPYEQRDAIAAWNRRPPANGEQVERVERVDLEAVLSDPTAVHLNMLRGGIAKPSLANIIHLYGEKAIRESLPTPTQDARKRVKVLEGILQRLLAGAAQPITDLPSGPIKTHDFARHSTARLGVTLLRELPAIRTALGNQEERL